MSATILIASGRSDDLAVLERHFRDLGYIVLTAEALPQAMETVRTVRPRVAVFDIDLPAGGGFEALRLTRDEGLYRCTGRLLLLRHDSPDEDVHRGFSFGAEGQYFRPSQGEPDPHLELMVARICGSPLDKEPWPLGVESSGEAA